MAWNPNECLSVTTRNRWYVENLFTPPRNAFRLVDFNYSRMVHAVSLCRIAPVEEFMEHYEGVNRLWRATAGEKWDKRGKETNP